MQPVVIRFGRLGDMVLLAPLLRCLHQAWGERCVLLGPGPWTAALYAAHPDVERVLETAHRHRPLPLSPERWRMVAWLHAHRHGAIHVCEPEPRALAKIRRMLRLAGVEATHCVWLGDAPAVAGEHWTERLLRACGRPPAACVGTWQAPAAPPGAVPQLVVRAADRTATEAWLHHRGWRGEDLWLVQPCNKQSVHGGGVRDDDDAKAWPRGRWLAALRALAADFPRARIVVCGAPPEAEWLEALVAEAASARIEVAARDLPIARLMALTAIARGMLSVDTGPAHVAAALGCPLVVMHGPHAPAEWRARGRDAVTVLGGPPEHHRVDEITLDEVVAAWRALPPRIDAPPVGAPLDVAV